MPQDWAAVGDVASFKRRISTARFAEAPWTKARRHGVTKLTNNPRPETVDGQCVNKTATAVANRAWATARGRARVSYDPTVSQPFRGCGLWSD